jgi:hypothetical protein
VVKPSQVKAWEEKLAGVREKSPDPARDLSVLFELRQSISDALLADRSAPPTEEWLAKALLIRRSLSMRQLHFAEPLPPEIETIAGDMAGRIWSLDLIAAGRAQLTTAAAHVKERKAEIAMLKIEVEKLTRQNFLLGNYLRLLDALTRAEAREEHG